MTGTTIHHSFRHAGLCTSSAGDEVETILEFENKDDLPITEWVEQFNMPNFTKNLQTYIEVDNSLATAASLTDEEILDLVRKTEEQQQRDEDDETDDPEPPPSKHSAAKLLEKYFLYDQIVPVISKDMNKIHNK